MVTLPWLTFRRFFGVFVGASEPGAEAPRSLDAELLVDTLRPSASLPCSAPLDGVVLAAAEPLALCVSSLINDGGVRRLQRQALVSEARRLGFAPRLDARSARHQNSKPL